MSTFREPVIGDDYDLETYGRPSASPSGARTRPRAHARYDRSAARARRINSHVPEHAKSSRAAEPTRPAEAGAVRTVKISGQATPPRRRAAALQIDRYERRPDRTAQWALFMGVFMVVVAVVTGS